MAGESETMRQCPIAIIGMDCLFPSAQGLHEYWRLIRYGEDAVTEVPETHWNISDYYAEGPSTDDLINCKRGAFLSPTVFDPVEWGIPPAVIEATDTAQLLGLVVAKRALNDAGYDDRRGFDRRRAGVILGVTGTQELTLPLTARLGHPLWRRALHEAGVAPDVAAEVVKRIADGYVRWQENSFPGLLGNVVAGRIANRLDLRGTNCVVDAACASSLGAVHLAVLELTNGRADVVLTGGVDTLNDIFMFMCFSKAQALSPTGDARPFSKNADGTVIGEGVGMLVLKRLEDAERDGDRIYAVLRGIGTSSDGRSQSIYAPHAVGQARALRSAYQISGVDPVTIGLVEAHGTGTKVGDVVEFDALTTVYREAKADGKWCALGSVKSQIGHTKAAAGAASLIKTVLALHQRVLPATIKVGEPNPKLGLEESPFYLSTETRPWFSKSEHPRRAAVSSFGFGGSNFHVVLEEHVATLPEVAWDGSVELVALSAPDPVGLEAMLKEWLAAAEKGLAANQLAARAARSRREFSAKDAYRLVLVIERGADLAKLIRGAKHTLKEKGTDHPWQLPNVFFSGPNDPGKLTFLFPGQGSQYVGMGRDLLCQFPEAFDAVAEADGDDERLSERIYPQPTFNAEQRRAQEGELKRTEVTQPALGAVSLALLRVLRRFGVQADFAAGHSFGELVALRAAGRIGDEALRTLARLRGRLMGQSGNGQGTMLAVEAPLEEIDRLLKEEGDVVVLANRNTPTQGVISGVRKAVERVARLCDQRGWRTRFLQVSAAFHSKFMASVYERFRAALEDVTFELGRIPVFANVTAGPYPAGVAEARDLLARQLTSPVNFVDLVRNLYDNGARTFIEVGPKNVLTGLVKSILQGKPLYALALDAGCGRGNGVADLARVLALLTVLGYTVDLQAWERPAPEIVQPNMAIRLHGANYRSSATTPVSAPAKTPAADAPAVLVPSEDVGNAGMSSSENAAARRAATTGPATVDHDAMVGATSAGPAPPSAQPPEANTDQLRQALEVVQESLRAMQTLQQQTATAHQRFLETQEQAHKTLQAAIESQQWLMERALGLPTSAPAAPSPTAKARPATTPRSGIAQASEEAASLTQPPSPTSPAGSQSLVGLDERKIETVLLRIVGEQTGYPVDSIHLDMRLEDDLGIDPVRQLEIVSALRKQFPSLDAEPIGPGAPPQTLRDVVRLGRSEPPGEPSTCGTGLPTGQETGPTRQETGPTRQETGPTRQETGPTRQEIGPADGRAGDGQFSQVVLDVVAELTGYPTEMLDLDMDMEADLGIDSIKRLEILGAVQRRVPEMEPVNSQHTGSLRTLRDIIEYARGAAQTPAASATPARQRPEPAQPETPPDPGGTGFQPVVPSTPPAAKLERRVLTTVDLPPAKQRPLRIASGYEVWVTDDGTPLAPTLVKRLASLGHTARAIGPRAGWKNAAQRKVGGLILLGSPAQSSCDRSGDRSHMGSWDEQAEEELKAAFQRVKLLGPNLRDAAASGGALLATISRLDGAFGLRGTFLNPLHGGLSGLAKTAAHEWPDVRCRALDVSATWQDVGSVADALVRELAADGPIEVALDHDTRIGLDAVDKPAPPGDPPLENGDVVVISGGARGVTAAAAHELARATGQRPVPQRLTLVLVGRSPAPTPEPDWLVGLDEEAEIKRALLANAFDGTKRPTPPELETEYRRRMANREVARNLDRLRTTGSKVVYCSVDVRDRAAVAKVFDEARRKYGPIRGLIHGAGVIADRRIEDKTPEQFARVFDTKVRGLRALLEATHDDDLKFLVLFSSASARFGRVGQVDYAMANEVLNKIARVQATLRPDCRVVSINWGPWDGGMVTPALKQEFARLGVELIPVEAGARCLVDELRSQNREAIEVLIGGSFGSLATGAMPAPGAWARHTAAAHDGRMSVAFERALNLDSHTFLGSHVIGGHPVLPAAMMLEWLGHGALHNNPGLLLHGFDDFRVFKGVILDNGPRTIRVVASRAKRTGGTFEVGVELRSGDRGGSETTHARAKALLTACWPQSPAFETPPSLRQRPYPAGAEDIYRDILFHGPHFHAIEHVEGISERGVVARVRTAPSPGEWMVDPVRTGWLADPLAVDAGLQLGSLWCHEELGTVSLPSCGASLRQYRPFPDDGVTVFLEVRETGPHRMMADVTFLDAQRRVVARMERYEWTVDPSLRAAFDRNVLATA